MNSTLTRATSTIVMTLMAISALAVVETLQFNSAGQEDRYRALINELRCLVCQNQNLADSNADLAADLREITYNMVMAGDTNREIKAYMTDRYGEFILYKPPLTAATLALWAGPFLLLFAVIVTLVVYIRRRNREAPGSVDDPAALERARSLLQAGSSNVD